MQKITGFKASISQYFSRKKKPDSTAKVNMEVEAEIQVHEDAEASSSSAPEACASASQEVKLPKDAPAAEEEPEKPVEVEIRLTETPKGKCLFAVSAIPADAVIFEEDPFVFCQFAWNKHCGYLACDHCLRPLEIVEANISRLTKHNNFMLPYPDSCRTDNRQHETCPDCMANYCSEKCLLFAFHEYHKTLCPRHLDPRPDRNCHTRLDDAWRKMHYPPETTTIFLIVRLLARIIQAPNKQKMVQKILSFCHKSTNEHEQLSHKFLGDAFKDQLIELRMSIARLLEPIECPEVEYFLTDKGFQTLIALVGTNAQGVATSPFSAWRRHVETLSLQPDDQEEVDELVEEILDYMDKCTGIQFLDNEGVGLYVKQSSVNHSCDPNAEIRFWNNNFRLSLVALKNIEPGEEICISYLDECQLKMSRHSRQKFLKENYLFVCVCPKCILQCDDPDVTSEDEPSSDENDDK